MKEALKTAGVSPKIWLHGLIAALIGGAAGGAQEALHHGIAEHNLNWQTIGTSAMTGAFLLGVGYLMKSPLFAIPTTEEPAPSPAPVSTPDTPAK